MPLDLPDFSDPQLDEITVCAVFEISASDWPSETRVGRMNATYDTASGQAGVGLMIDRPKEDDGRAHIHFYIRRNWDPGLAKRGTSEPVDLSVIRSSMDKFIGREMAIYVEAEYSIPREALPKGGMIATLSPLSTKIADCKLSLAGMRMRIDGEPFTRLEWELEDESVSVELSSCGELLVGAQYLTDAVKLMRDGVDKFVLEAGSHSENVGE